MTWPRDRFSPASLRAFANAPLTSEAVEPVETLPSLADSHLDNLQAANRQLRDDLAAAERKAAAYAELLACVGGTLAPTERGHVAWQVGHECIAYLTVGEADMLRDLGAPVVVDSPSVVPERPEAWAPMNTCPRGPGDVLTEEVVVAYDDGTVIRWSAGVALKRSKDVRCVGWLPGHLDRADLPPVEVTP